MDLTLGKKCDITMKRANLCLACLEEISKVGLGIAMHCFGFQ
jgi:hypothetical protein